jgi:hypothetical protein
MSASFRPASAFAENELARRRPPSAEAAGALERLRPGLNLIVDDNLPGRRRLRRCEAIAIDRALRVIDPQGRSTLKSFPVSG